MAALSVTPFDPKDESANTQPRSRQMNRTKATSHPFTHATEVTAAHAEKFVEAMYGHLLASGITTDALSESGVMDYDRNEDCPTEFLDAQDAIADVIERELRGPLGDAFAKAVFEVLGITSSSGANLNRKAVTR